MTYTNEQFKDDLTQYLQAKRAKQAKRAQMPLFFRTLSSDPAYQAKVDFVGSLIRRIDRGENDRVGRLVQRGIDGREGFTYSPVQIAASRLYRLLFVKSNAMEEEKASHPVSSSTISLSAGKES